MQGYDVRTIDDDKIGHVIDTDGDFLIVEHGLLKSKHALPMAFAEVDDDEKVVRTTLSKDLIHHSPKVNGEIDRRRSQSTTGWQKASRIEPTRATGDLEPDDPAYGADEPLRERVRGAQESMSGDAGPFDEPPSSPGVHRRHRRPRLRRRTEPAGSRHGSSSRGAHPARCAPRRTRASPDP